MRFASGVIGCAVVLSLVGCSNTEGDQGGARGGSGGTGGVTTGGTGGPVGGGGATAGTGGIGGGGATAGTGGSCATPGDLCRAQYAPSSLASCAATHASPCADDEPCGAGHIVSSLPNFENSTTCIYDAQGAIISATTCGYEAHYTYCPKRFECGGGGNLCNGSPTECFRVGADVTCANDADGGLGPS